MIDLAVLRSVIVIQLPTYGILHKSNQSETILTAKLSEVEILSAEKVFCLKMFSSCKNKNVKIKK